MSHYRHCTMVAGTHCHTGSVENGADIMRVDTCYGERQNTGLFPSGTDQAQTSNCLGLFGGIGEQCIFVSGNRRQAQFADVVDRRAEADAASDMRGARLKLVGQIVISSLGKSNFTNHVTATLIRRHGVE